jgi:hypothetical protein
MLEFKRLWHQICQKTAIIMLAGLIWLISLPTTPVQADGYYSNKAHRVEASRPYYSSKDRQFSRTDNFLPYYATQERKKEKNYLTPASPDDYFETGRRAGDVNPKDLGTSSRQKNGINILNRAGEEVTNEPQKRPFGARD